MSQIITGVRKLKSPVLGLLLEALRVHPNLYIAPDPLHFAQVHLASI